MKHKERRCAPVSAITNAAPTTDRKAPSTEDACSVLAAASAAKKRSSSLARFLSPAATAALKCSLASSTSAAAKSGSSAFRSPAHEITGQEVAWRSASKET